MQDDARYFQIPPWMAYIPRTFSVLEGIGLAQADDGQLAACPGGAAPDVVWRQWRRRADQRGAARGTGNRFPDLHGQLAGSGPEGGPGQGGSTGGGASVEPRG